MKSLRRKSEKGFTLIELMIVVMIFAILAALAWGSVGKTHHEAEVRGVGFQLASMIKALRARSVSTGLEQGLAINFGPADWVTANVTVSANSWTAFQGSLPCSPLTCPTQFGNEDSASATATIGPMVAPGPPLQAFYGSNTSGGGGASLAAIVDIFSIRNCACEAANGACGACLVPAENAAVTWLLFQPDGTIVVPSLNNRPINFTIYLGLSELITGNYNNLASTGTADPLSRANRWRVVVTGFTGRARLLRGWSDALDPDPNIGGT